MKKLSRYPMSRLKSARLFYAGMILAGMAMTASAQTPEIKGYNFPEGDYLFPFCCDTLKVNYSVPVEKSYWEIYQNGEKVLEGVDDGKSMGHQYSTFKIKSTLEEAMIKGTLKEGAIDFKIAKVEYDGGKTFENLPNVTWKLTDAPYIFNLYPLYNPDSPSEIKRGTSAYIFGPGSPKYFVGAPYSKGASQLKNAKVFLVQNNTKKNELDFAGVYNATTSKWNSTVKLEFQEEDLENLDPGRVEVMVVEITYISPIDGTEKVMHVEPALPSPNTNPSKQGGGYLPGMAKFIYSYGGPAAKIIEESHKDDEAIIRSWYPADGEEGVLTFTANQPLAPGATALLHYGLGDDLFNRIVPVTLNEDGVTLSVDLRGMCNSAYSLTGGHQFREIDGSPLENPTVINLEISNLYTTKGNPVVTEYVAPGTTKVNVLNAKLWRTYNFDDISFPNPVISNVVFFHNDNVSNKTEHITDTSNMVEIQLTGDETIESADVNFTSGNATATVVYSEITRKKGIWTLALPEIIREAGSETLVVSLTNLTFSIVDGDEHKVAPFDFAQKIPAVPQTATVATMLELEPETEVWLTTDNLRVTFVVPESGMTFAEDNTGAIMVVTEDYATPLQQGKLVSGTLKGTYNGFGMFTIDPGTSVFTSRDVDISTGMTLTSLEDLSNPAHTHRLVTIYAEDGFDLRYSEEDGGISINNGEYIIVDLLDALPEKYEYPEHIASVTGIIYKSETDLRPIILIRSADDIQAGQTNPSASSLAELTSLPEGTPVTLNVDGAVVTHAANGMLYLQDATAAVMIGNLLEEDGAEIKAVAGNALYGTLNGVYYGNSMFAVNPLTSSFRTEPIDVTYGETILIEEIKEPRNRYRLVTFLNTKESPIVSTQNGIWIGSTVMAVDMFGALDYDYVFPEKISSVTGILIPIDMVSPMSDDNTMEGMPDMLLALRNGADIVVETGTGIDQIMIEGNAIGDVYDINGVKVRNAGESLSGLAKGVYLVNGHKIYILK